MFKRFMLAAVIIVGGSVVFADLASAGGPFRYRGNRYSSYRVVPSRTVVVPYSSRRYSSYSPYSSGYRYGGYGYSPYRSGVSIGIGGGYPYGYGGYRGGYSGYRGGSGFSLYIGR